MQQSQNSYTPSRKAGRHRVGLNTRALALLTGLTLLLSSCGTLKPDEQQLGVAATCGTTNLALKKPATASSTENAGYLGAAQAVDGNMTTRWASLPSDPQWLQVDLGSTQTVCGVTLVWERDAAYGKAFKIQVSNTPTDDTKWITIYETTTGTGGTQTITPTTTASGRHIRMYGTGRGTGYGYSLFEFKVFAESATTTPPPTTGPTGPGITRVTGTQGNWQLSVDGAPYVKGLTWGPPVSEAASRMPDLKLMGVNTIRTWGTDASSQALFDAAAANGIKVMAGFWLSPGGGPGSGGCPNYVTDSNYKSTMLSEIQKWVGQYKTHKGVLMWNVGNESILGMQNCFSGTELENQRNAYAKFVNEAARAIHAIDPNHPVTNTDAWTGAWSYLKANAPDLDLYSVNAYNAVCDVKQNWINGGYTKPYLITEGGPAGEWEVPDDANGVPTEPTDVQKRDGYTRAWGCITGHTGVALGATLFHYGTEGDFGGVWFNLIPNGEKRLSYYAVRKMYGGAPAANTPPVISSMALSNATNVPAGGTFTVSASVSDPDGDPISYTMGYNSKYINNAGGIISATFTGSGPWTVTAPQQLGVWKVYLYARDGKGNIGIETRSLRVAAPPVQGTNIALNKPTTASSFQPEYNGRTFFPGYATDGNAATNWGSDWSDAQWLEVDLGSVMTFNHVQLVWETAYGKAYKVEVSDDRNLWRKVYETATGDGNTDDFGVSNASGRYVRMTGIQRGTEFGYALYEFGVYRTP
ncbi:MAG: CBM32 / CBM47 [uncultured Truepera sp.]|uniref:CBM32 / CBM47 n=1 Tax=uncultured Truepera sp. TaxID=543023 RepID=A0A6J4VSY0_9DEIN|nr:MAG: CBM32 / CBM47 [uncultured Truepera sp.]